MILNHTNLKDAKVGEIIRLVKPSGLGTFDIRISNTRQPFCCNAYPEGCSFHGNNRPLVVAKVNTNENLFPIRHYYPPIIVLRKSWNTSLRREEIVKSLEYSKKYVDCVFLSREEALVYVIADGLRYISKSKRRVWGAKGRYSSLDAYAYALKMVRKWRRRSKVQDDMQLLEQFWNQAENSVTDITPISKKYSIS